ncbi:hypothetical protein AAJ76_1100064062 [Vairimorpha ceranae]|uniref:Uncharacterized protein n=1 Tax=Vairimorpha ceranae TaxID=40302 RepID=A0A0F9YTI3_9MICR|nr:hypothetical protein AAJ76_1100064062 [Vairimorpha ceranae]KKO75837.1 hypothetical protein AAJ76_1100064062 [Vairimorpha ceranae]
MNLIKLVQLQSFKFDLINSKVKISNDLYKKHFLEHSLQIKALVINVKVNFYFL